jgi:GH18 family chitinase
VGNWRKRRIAYYETWAETRPCDTFRAEEIPIKTLTHVNIAFAGIKDSMVDIQDSIMVRRIIRLKGHNPSAQVFIAVGGWAFSDPGRSFSALPLLIQACDKLTRVELGPTRTAWSDMASTKENRLLFINSLIWAFLDYNLDGVDLDWEYPVAGTSNPEKESRPRVTDT